MKGSTPAEVLATLDRLRNGMEGDIASVAFVIVDAHSRKIHLGHSVDRHTGVDVDLVAGATVLQHHVVQDCRPLVELPSGQIPSDDLSSRPGPTLTRSDLDMFVEALVCFGPANVARASKARSRAGFIANLIGLGHTRASALCRRYGVDPDESIQ